MLGGPRGAASWAGDSGRNGGVPNRGGELPRDSFNAEERFDSAGPGSDAWGSARPGSGVCIDDELAVWEGVGIWRTAGVPLGREGMGEPSRAIEPARTDCDSGELPLESRDDEGTACGFVEAERSPDMLGCVCC